MQKRVKIFKDWDFEKLENEINSFLKFTNGSTHDVKYQYSVSYSEKDDGIEWFSALVIFTPDNEDEKQSKSEKGSKRVHFREAAFRV